MEDIVKLFELLPKEEIERRVRSFQNILAQKGISYALIFQSVNLFYFTGTIQKGYLVLPAEQEPVLAVQKDRDRAKLESPVHQVPMTSLKQLPEIVSSLGLKTRARTGIEFESVPIKVFFKLQAILGHNQFEDISMDLLVLRAKKSSFELSQIRKSGQFVDHVFSVAPYYIRENMTEVELAGQLQAESRKTGHQEIVRMRGIDNELTNPHILSAKSGLVPSGGDVPLSGYGVNQAVAQGASLKKIEKDAPIIIDYAGGCNGYATDETRIFVLGRIKEIWHRAYQVALEVLNLFEDKARPGMVTGDIYSSVLDLVEKRGLLENFMGFKDKKVNFVGHGIGLVINELPIIALQRQEILEENMVMAIEPKFLFPDQGAIGVEVDYIVREDRLERVTSFPTEIVRV